jgi:hypothetical protein
MIQREAHPCRYKWSIGTVKAKFLDTTRLCEGPHVGSDICQNLAQALRAIQVHVPNNRLGEISLIAWGTDQNAFLVVYNQAAFTMIRNHMNSTAEIAEQ